MAETQQEERTEAATPRRLQKAREEGQVPVSRELATLAGLAAVTLAVMLFVPGMLHDLARRLSVFLARAHELGAGCASVPRRRPRPGSPARRRSCWPRCSPAARRC